MSLINSSDHFYGENISVYESDSESAAFLVFETASSFIAESVSAGEDLLVLRRTLAGLLDSESLSSAQMRVSALTGVFSLIATSVSAGESYFSQNINNLEFSSESFSKSDIFLRLNDEANVFLENLTSENLSLGEIGFSQDKLLLLEADSVSSAALDFSSRNTESENTFNLLVTVLPALAVGGFYHEDTARLTVDGTEVDIQSYGIEAGDDSFGETVTVTLSDFSDKSKISKDAYYKFEIGSDLTGAGDWQWRTIFESGELSSNSLSIAFGNFRNDSFELTMADPLQDRLNLSPPKNLIIYDGSRLKVEAGELEAVYDLSGRIWRTDAVKVNNLKLYDLFQMIFVERLGFEGYNTNIPNYPIRRYDATVESGYYQGLKAHIGMFEPELYVVDGILQIQDTTNLFSEGFPAPRELTDDRYESLNLSNRQPLIDGFVLYYNEDDGIYPFSTRLEQKTTTSGSFGSSDYSEHYVEQRWRDYHPSELDSVTVIKEELESELRRTTNSDFAVISEIEETFRFDGFARLVGSSKTETALTFEVPAETMSLQTVLEERMSIQYAAHPFLPRLQYQRTLERVTRGMIVVDKENKQLGQDWKKPIKQAFSGGNLNSEMSVEYGPIETYRETFTPQQNGQVKCDYYRYDEVVGAILDDRTENKPGDVSVSGTYSRSRRMWVFRDGQTERTAKRMEPFGVGEVPLAIAVPLAVRMLLKRLTKGAGLNLELPGLELYLQKGQRFTVRGRDNENLGAFLVTGYAFRGQSLGDPSAQNHGTSIRVKKI